MSGTEFKPDFIVIGAMRAGTTTLHNLLARHPQIGMSHLKETDFFLPGNDSRGWGWYAAQFPRNAALRGESSPNYAKANIFPGVAERIAEALPEAKLIYVVRDPVERMESHYRHLVLSSGLRLPAARLPGSDTWEKLVETSLYHWQITRFRHHLDHDRVKVLDFDRFAARPGETLEEVAGFLGLSEPFSETAAPRSNSSGELARLPRWAHRLRDHRAGRLLRTAVPRRMRRGVKRAMVTASGGERPTEGLAFPERVRAAATEAVAEDAERFRALTGLDFPGWGV